MVDNPKSSPGKSRSMAMTQDLSKTSDSYYENNKEVFKNDIPIRKLMQKIKSI